MRVERMGEIGLEQYLSDSVPLSHGGFGGVGGVLRAGVSGARCGSCAMGGERMACDHF